MDKSGSEAVTASSAEWTTSKDGRTDWRTEERPVDRYVKEPAQLIGDQGSMGADGHRPSGPGIHVPQASPADATEAQVKKRRFLNLLGGQKAEKLQAEIDHDRLGCGVPPAGRGRGQTATR